MDAADILYTYMVPNLTTATCELRKSVKIWYSDMLWRTAYGFVDKQTIIVLHLIFVTVQTSKNT